MDNRFLSLKLNLQQPVVMITMKIYEGQRIFFNLLFSKAHPVVLSQDRDLKKIKKHLILLAVIVTVKYHGSIYAYIFIC